MKKTTNEKKVRITIIETDVFEVSTHETLLSSLTKAGIMLEAICGGQGSCGKCRIKVLSGQVVDEHGEVVESMDGGWFLACKVYPALDLVIDKTARAKVSSKGEISDQFLENVDFFPLVKKVLIRPAQFPRTQSRNSFQSVMRRERVQSKRCYQSILWNVVV